MDFTRTAMVLGKEQTRALKNKRVLVCGLGGVGGACFEALVRLGVGKFTLVDGDVFDASNLNRQILATEKTLGRAKVEVARDRGLSIQPDLDIEIHQVFLEEDFAFLGEDYDGVLDCIDSVKAKLNLYRYAQERGLYLLSSMGMGNKMKPEEIKVSTLYKTKVDPLARSLRKKCKDLGIEDFPVVYSEEEPTKSLDFPLTSKPGSLAFVPPVAGYILASLLLKHWLQEPKMEDRKGQK